MHFRIARQALSGCVLTLVMLVLAEAAAASAQLAASDPPAALPGPMDTSAPKPAAPSSSRAGAEHFDIAEFRVLGNTVLPVEAIERAIYPYTGPDKSIEDVQSARAALEKAYHAAGYGTVFVDVPEQDVGAGIVRLRATEGRLDRVRVTGARYVSGRRLLAQLPAATPGTVPQLPTLQAQLSEVNSASADRSVTPVLKAGRTPGTVDLELQVKDELPLHGGLTLNNRYTPDTTHLRGTVDLSYGNLFQDAQSLALEYQTAPQRTADERVYSLSYVAPLWTARDLIALYAIDTNSNVAAVGALSLLGVGRVYGAHFIHLLPNFGGLTQNLNVGADYKDFSQTVNVVGQPPDKTPIRYVNWSTVYSLSEVGPHHTTSVNFGGDFGLRGVVNHPAQFDYKRSDAKPDYVYLKGTLEHVHVLPFGMGIDLKTTYQLASGPLVSNEQYGVGGVDTVRGYLESIELGDSGATGSVELRSPTWKLWFDPTGSHFGLFAFYDAGMARVLEPLSDQQSQFTLASAGAGLRFVLVRHLDGWVEWADPLRTVSTVERNHSRVEFQVHYGF